jgi:hypothetical protein
MSEQEFWQTVRRALRLYNEAQSEEQKLRAHSMILRAMEKYCPEKTEPFGSRAAV